VEEVGTFVSKKILLTLGFFHEGFWISASHYCSQDFILGEYGKQWWLVHWRCGAIRPPDIFELFQSFNQQRKLLKSKVFIYLLYFSFEH